MSYQNDLEYIIAKSILHTPGTYPRVPNVGCFTSTISPFLDTRLSIEKIENALNDNKMNLNT